MEAKNMKKILYVASKVKLHINLFHTPFFKKLKEDGYEVHVCASNDYANKDECVIPWCDVFHEVLFNRIPFHPDNIRAYLKLKKIIDTGGYDIIHCHTPIGGALARLAARGARKKGCKVIYTAHGFHFFKGAPLLNWMLYYTAERFLSWMTDLIITINEEDYTRAQRFRGPVIVKMNGVGIDVSEFSEQADCDCDCAGILEEIGIPKNGIVLVFAGEMSYRKHQDFLLKVLLGIEPIKDVYLILAGEGSYAEKYRKKAIGLGVDDRVFFLGFRKDIDSLMCASDMYVSASRQEELPVNIMEAMASGLPIVCFDIRGNSDLVENGRGGYLVPPDDCDEFSKRILELIGNAGKRDEMADFNRARILYYSRDRIVNEMMDLYKKVLG